MILPPTSEISHHYNDVTNITVTGNTGSFFFIEFELLLKMVELGDIDF